jgi:hypothetical protein
LRLVLPVVRELFGDSGREGTATSRNGGTRQASGPGGCCAPTRSASGLIVVLFKPQFEAAKAEVPRGGVIRDVGLQAALLGRFVSWCVGNGFRMLDLVASPILGAEGNREVLVWLRAVGDGAAEAGKPRLRGARPDSGKARPDTRAGARAFSRKPLRRAHRETRS